MIAAEHSRAMHPSFLGASGNVKQNVQHMRQSGQFYVTPEVDRELKHIEQGVDHIRLDHDLMTTSKEWGSKFNPNAATNEKRGRYRIIFRK